MQNQVPEEIVKKINTTDESPLDVMSNVIDQNENAKLVR
jgi:hypothetical protein